ncbi:AIPR family protein [Paenibacillus sp. SER-28]
MDIITVKYFEKFIEEFNISGGATERNFEKFVNYCMLFPKNISNFNLSSVSTGDGGDCAIDGLAIVLNNRFISTIGELEDILDTGMEFSLELYFIQTKMSQGFEGKEMLQFGNGVVDVFKSENQSTKVRNEKIKEKCRMIQVLLDNYDSFSTQPKCYLYFVTTGTWANDVNLIVDKDKIISDVKGLELFEVIEFFPFGVKEIRKHYELTKLQNSATFELKDKIELPYMEGVKESYLAILPAREYLKIIVDEQNKIVKGIFELNVRDFNGIEKNRVNQDIINTINSDDKNYFGLLNNGITIVGKSLSKGKGLYTIKNFYVVNGCQTSNILHLSSVNVDDSMWVAIKIVITENDDIISNIVKATNNQTEVQQIQLLSMSEYQELLESFYANYDGIYNLYYERRSGQYNYNNNIEKSKIVNPEMQIRAFASIFLDAPHRASRSYGSLVEDIGKDNDSDISRGIFVTGQQPIVYYTSALLLHILENSFTNDKLDERYSKFRYHLLFLISKIIWKNEKRPPLNSRKIEDYCEILINKVTDEKYFEELLKVAKSTLNRVVINLEDQEINKSAAIINLLLMYINLGLTTKIIRARIGFLDEMDVLLAPFYNLKIDGDFRYNFKDRVNDLKRRIGYYQAKLMEEFIDSVVAKLNEDVRQSRKECAAEIYNYMRVQCDDFKRSIEESKKYTKQSK